MQQARKTHTTLILVGALVVLAGCTLPQTEQPNEPLGPQQSATAPIGDRPEDAPPGTCWDYQTTPAIVQTTTERVLIEPADISSDGTIRTPARYRNEDKQTILQPRQVQWYEIVCDGDLTQEFISSLQRALAARGYYAATTTGELDDATQDAIASYQVAEGLPGFKLSKAAAEKLGLVVSSAVDTQS